MVLQQKTPFLIRIGHAGNTETVLGIIYNDDISITTAAAGVAMSRIILAEPEPCCNNAAMDTIPTSLTPSRLRPVITQTEEVSYLTTVFKFTTIVHIQI
jgi:hypothetical protein